TRLADPSHTGDGPLARGPVLLRQHQRLGGLAVGALLDAMPGDVTFLFDDLRDLLSVLAVRHRHVVVARRVRVTQTGQHVCDWIGHGHGCVNHFPAVVTGVPDLRRSGNVTSWTS